MVFIKIPLKGSIIGYFISDPGSEVQVVLVHDAQSNDLRSNNARFKHKLYKHAYFI